MKNIIKNFCILITFIVVTFLPFNLKVKALSASYFQPLSSLEIEYKTKGIDTVRNFKQLGIFAVDNTHAFCLEPATGFSTGTVTETNFDDYSLKTYGKMSTTQLDLMKKISTYAIKLTDPTSTTKRVSLYRSLATQALYWEIISGERTTFASENGKEARYSPDNKVANSFYDKMVSNASKNDVIACINDEYETLVESVYGGFYKNPGDLFATGSSIKTETLDYDEDKKVWSLTIYDDAFSYWDIVQPEEDYITVVKNKSGNKTYCGGQASQTLYSSITITSTKEITSPIKLEIKTAVRPKRDDETVNLEDYNGGAKIYVNKSNSQKQALMDIDGIITSKYLNVKTESVTYGLKIYKKDVDTDKYISGAEFELCSDENCEDVIDTDSAIGSLLPATFFVDSPGTYYYREITPPDGYILDDSIKSVEISSENLWSKTGLEYFFGNAKEVIVTNKKGVTTTTTTTTTTKLEEVINYQLKIKKIDKTSKEALEGVKFRICSDINCKNILSTATTDENGEIIYNKLTEAKTYYAVETMALEGYNNDDTPHEIEVTIDDVVGTKNYAEITVENTKKTYGFNLTKHTMDEAGNVTILDDGCNSSDSSATFTIKNSSGEELYFEKIENGKYKPALSTQEGATKEVKTCNGAFEVTTLTECEYTITETKAPNGVTLPPNASKKVNVCGSDKNISFTNGFTGLEFQKKDENGNFISGGKFALEQKINGTWMNVQIQKKNTGVYTYSKDEGEYLFETNEGIAYISGLPVGEYRVVEKEAPADYELIEVADSPKITISDEYKDGYYILTMINHKVNKNGGDASAELVITITTGRKVLNYVLIVSSLAALLVIAIIIRKKIKK